MDHIVASRSSHGDDDDDGDLSLWEDFPKGLKVLLLDEDAESAKETKLKLERLDYVVSLFRNDEEACEALARNTASFHVAVLEITRSNREGVFKFLQMAQCLPTVVISGVCSLNTMMRCIALGAAEFIQRPLSEEKLRNTWQHVVHKAFDSGRCVPRALSSLKPVREIVFSTLDASGAEEQEGGGRGAKDGSCRTEPSTPQLEHGGRSSSRRSSSTRSKYGDGDDKTGAKTAAVASESSKRSLKSSCTEAKKSGSSRRKAKQTQVAWSPELHKRFVRAVEQLGIQQAIPSKILELMRVDGLTRHNVASHLQKYRMHKRQILPKQDVVVVGSDGTAALRRLQHQALPQDGVSNLLLQRPLMTAAAAYGVNCHHPYPWYRPYFNYSWVPHGYQCLRTQTWGHPAAPAFLQADVWGCPVIPAEFGQIMPSSQHVHIKEDDNNIDEVVREALSKPWLPLPLGLKPPSTETVLKELHHLGIHTCLPTSCRPG